MQENKLLAIKNQPRFGGIFEDGKGFDHRIHLTSDQFLNDTHDFEINESAVSEFEEKVSSYLNSPYVIATNSGTSAMHVALILAAKKVFGADGLKGQKVFCSDLCPIEQAMPILYEQGEPVFIDVTDYDFNMDPECLEIAFETYPDTKIVVTNHLYGFPGQVEKIKEICGEHGAILIENASESFGASVEGEQTGTIGDIGVLDFGRGKIISAESGGAVVVGDKEEYDFAKQLINMPMRNYPWQQCPGTGYDYSMNKITAVMLLRRLPHIDEVIDRQKRIYELYQENLNDDLFYLIEARESADPNYWVSVAMCDSPIEAEETRTEDGYSYEDIHGTTSPMEIVDALEAFNAEAAPIYMPMSLQPAFKDCELITLDGLADKPDAYGEDGRLFISENSIDAFKRCVCLPSDISMTEEEQMKVIEIINACFNKSTLDRKVFVL